MKRYNYREAVTEDIKEFIRERYSDEEVKEIIEQDNLEEVYDEAFVSDTVTGNASGSYYCNAYKAEEAVAHNLDLLSEAMAEFGDDGNLLTRGAEVCDVTIRCYLLGECLAVALAEIEEEL